MLEMNGNEKVITLFNYIKELSNLKSKTVCNIKDQFWHISPGEIPVNDDFITVNCRDSVEGVEYDDILLEVRKPDMLPCPDPDETFREWLNDGWNMPQRMVSVMESMPVLPTNSEASDDQEPQTVAFIDDEKRVSAFVAWKIVRDKWAAEQFERLKIRDLFTTLYKLHVTMQRDTDTRELLVGNGLLTDKTNSSISHPVILKRVQTEFDALSNVVRIIDTDAAPELYTPLLTSIEDFSVDALSSYSEQLFLNSYHPLDNVTTPNFLRRLLHSLSPDSQFIDSPDVQRSDRFQIRLYPVFLVRARRDGAPKAIEAIIKDIQEKGVVPAHLINLVGEGKITADEDTGNKSLPDQLAEVGGEDTEILLTKAANREQLEIARRIAKYDAVLVQGPPGTGKTHTIANLIGHFLSQGKTVLVSSHTKKALSVVKGQVEKDLQDLCVAMLDDSNSDMEKSVDGITDMITKYSLPDLKSKIQFAEIARKAIISKLATVRQRIYEIKNSEFTSIVIGGDSISPTAAAQFVNSHPECNIIPGKVELRRVMPLSYEELQLLYSSNAVITSNEETELGCDLPNPDDYPSPDMFADLVKTESNAKSAIDEACSQHGFTFRLNNAGMPLLSGSKEICISLPSRDGLDALTELLKGFATLDEWMIYAAVDGRAGGGRASNWQTLISKLLDTMEYSESLIEECFGKAITFADDADYSLLKKAIPAMAAATVAKARLNKLDYMLHSDYKAAEGMVLINGIAMSCHTDYEIIVHQLKLRDMRDECGRYWNELMSLHGLREFADLDRIRPETIAVKMITDIKRYLGWFENELSAVKNVLAKLGLSEDQIFMPATLDTDIDETRKILSAINQTLPFISGIVENYLTMEEIKCYLQESFADITVGSRDKSDLCRNLQSAMKLRSKEDYRNAYHALKVVYDKYKTLGARQRLLDKLYAVAPDWSYAIRVRDGQHGMNTVPKNIDNAWLWKQYTGILDELSQESLAKLQTDSIALSRQYREKTAELAKWKAWHALKERIESNLSLKSSLISFKQVTKKVGKAKKMTGIYREEARKHMINCQQAVSAWIMPMAKVFENYTPGQNTFDVIIVDEASQSDITALAMTYLAKKVVIVGDDKQVSPTAVGIDQTRMIQLAEGTIKGIIPSWELYTGTTSLYDIVSTVYPSLMLREHFRCVPDIIGYSNKLSYDYKIKPLRDTSGCVLQPAVVNYRVNGHRDDNHKQNDVEARTIIALMKACIERKEYDGKTFGIISLLGDEQPRLIEKYLFEQFGADVIDQRKIIWGTSAQFQGDERDVIFLSLVDSNETDGPLKLQGFGNEDMYRKRYNVAVSRARDQLWLVHSLDSGRDLKNEDIRKGLLDYTANPQAFQQLGDKVSAQAESPFEESVGKSIVARGYSLVQQWPVGAYRIDMVVVDGKKRVAVECDGERWHSSELQVRNDMERQTILERLGWRFIRIRGSEYYRDPESTMVRVFSEIESLGIHPVGNAAVELPPDTDLLTAIKARAEEMLSTDGFAFDSGDFKTSIEYAQNAKSTSDCTTSKVKAHIEKGEAAERTSEKLISKSAADTAKKKDTAIKPVAEKHRNAEKTKYPLPQQLSTPERIRPSVLSNGQMTIFDAMDSPEDSSMTDVIEFIKQSGVQFVDNRSQKGSLWIIGGLELEPFVSKCKKFGLQFKFKEGGGRATGNKDAWWAK